MKDKAPVLRPLRTGGGCLKCREHASVCEVVHSLHARVIALEQRVEILERPSGSHEQEQENQAADDHH
jgi:hypothetical protein